MNTLNEACNSTTDHIEYLMTIGKGGESGVMSLLKSPEDHARWEANMRWFAAALLENTEQLLANAKSFYNATVADKEVRISSASSEKRDIAATSADRLRESIAIFSAPIQPVG